MKIEHSYLGHERDNDEIGAALLTIVLAELESLWIISKIIICLRYKRSNTISAIDILSTMIIVAMIIQGS